jgi:hypothetical protein
MISPRFATHTTPTLTQCTDGHCLRLPPQPTNLIYLHSTPSPSSPLLSDPLLHPDGAPGTTRLDDWSARASIGQSFVVAGQLPGWTAIWFAGQRAWFADPPTHPVSVTVTPPGTLLAPRPGCTTIPVYGSPDPEPSAYPPAIAPIPLTRLPYVIPAGQVYLGVDLVPASSFYARFDGPGQPKVPANRTLVTGRRRMWQISFNHRRAFLDAADVQAHTPHPTPKTPGQPPPCTNPPPPARVLTVRPGDTLDTLARSHHLPGGWPALYHTNRSQLPDPDRILPGQHLTLP